VQLTTEDEKRLAVHDKLHYLAALLQVRHSFARSASFLANEWPSVSAAATIIEEVIFLAI
jgi:hypothetical protein